MPTLLRKTLIGSGLALGLAVVGQNAVAGGGAPWPAFDGHANVDLERGDVNSACTGSCWTAAIRSVPAVRSQP